MITADEVQFAYPKPKSGHDRTRGMTDYCVGGAFMCAIGLGGNAAGCGWFPCDLDLANALMVANGNLEKWDATNFAERITIANDNEDFDEAWLALREALKWEPEA